MRLVAATDDDLAEILALDTRLFGDGAWPVTKFMSWWNAGAVKMIVAKEQNITLGFADAFNISNDAYQQLTTGMITSDMLTTSDVKDDGGCWWIGAVAVDIGHQRRGVGRGLWDSLNDAVEGKVCVDIWSAAGTKLLAGSPNWQLALPGKLPDKHPVWVRTQTTNTRINT